MSDQETQQRWDKRYEGSGVGTPAPVLLENAHLLPKAGRALDLACGMAANGMFLAEQGLEVDAWDISPVAVEKVNELGRQRGLNITAKACDLGQEKIPEANYDVLICCHFLERGLTQAIVDALKPGGLLFYQTFTQTAVNPGGPEKAEWRLADQELLTMFQPFKVLVYREEGVQGDTTRGFRDKALIVAKKETTIC